MSIRTSVQFLSFALLLGGCPEVITEPTDSGEEPVLIEAEIVGDWLSSGDDVSAYLRTFSIVEVTASFRDDGSYEVLSETTDGTVNTLTGTYTVDTSTDPATVSINQDTPYNASVEGIWAVDGDVLTYEIVQTSPTVGNVAPPTVEGGFGSSVGIDEGDNIQIFQAL